MHGISFIRHWSENILVEAFILNVCYRRCVHLCMWIVPGVSWFPIWRCVLNDCNRAARLVIFWIFSNRFERGPFCLDAYFVKVCRNRLSCFFIDEILGCSIGFFYEHHFLQASSRSTACRTTAYIQKLQLGLLFMVMMKLSSYDIIDYV